MSDFAIFKQTLREVLLNYVFISNNPRYILANTERHCKVEQSKKINFAGEYC